MGPAPPRPDGRRDRVAASEALATWNTADEDGLFTRQVLLHAGLAAAGPGALHRDPSLAHGLAGLLHAQQVCSLGVEDADVADLEHRALSADPGESPGLLDGLGGMAWVLGRRDAADHVDREAAGRTRGAGPSLAHGAPGVALAHLSREGSAGWALDIASSALAEPASGAGLLMGAAGAALLGVRAYEATADRAFLTGALDVLDASHAACVVLPDASAWLDAGGVLEHGLANGSGGLALVAAQAARHADSRRLLPQLTGFVAAARRGASRPGLLDGAAGMVHVLVAIERLLPGAVDVRAALATQVQRLQSWVQVGGDSMLVVACGDEACVNLAEGTCGVLTALQAYSQVRHDEDRCDWRGLLPALLPHA